MMNPLHKHKKMIVAVTLACFSGVAFGGVVTGLPPKPALPPKLPPQSTTPQQDVPAIGGASASGTSATGPDTAAAAPKLNAAQEWQHLVAAPPSAKESFETKEQAIAALVAAQKAHAISNLPPIAGSNGEVLYPYNGSWPTLMCSPDHLCEIDLGTGVKAGQVAIGSPGEWKVVQAMSGNQPDVILSPRSVGLHTNLIVTATSPSGKPLTFRINLVSDNAQYVPAIGFYYPSHLLTKWHLQAADAQAHRQKVAAETVASLPSINASSLNFNWSVHCSGGGWFSSSDCSTIRPTTVFDDGTHTYIKMPAGISTHGGMPAVLTYNSDNQPAVYTPIYKDGYIIIGDVPPEIVLKTGVGEDALEVKIRHK